MRLPIQSHQTVELNDMSLRSRVVGHAVEVPAADVENPPLRPAPSRQSKGNSQQPNTSAYLALFGVAMLWGSYAPAIRYIFLSDEPPSAPVMNALQAVLSAMFLAGSSIAAAVTHKDPNAHPEMSNPLAAESAAIAQVVAEVEAGQSEGRRTAVSALEHMCAQALNWKSDNVVVVGFELGLWMCLAFGLEVLGVQLISATKTAFLNQATVLITPMLVHLSGEHVKKHEWVACMLGLMGSLLVAADGLMSGGGEGHGVHGAVAVGDEENPLGYLYVLISAVFFAMTTVRLSRYSTSFPSLTLASSSTFGLSLLSMAWVVASWQGEAHGYSDTMRSLRHLFSDPLSSAVMLWVGLGPGALATYLQAAGQQSVPAAQAQVIYATTPIFATAFAMLTLDAADESMGMIAWTGAAFMMGASLLASVGGGGAQSSATSDNQQ
jgi:drug/metabolite transporter (DMT)-like permease